jgi:cell division protein FtsI (penicillin-binding protein 3)
MHETPEHLAEKIIQAPYSKSGISEALSSTFEYLDLPYQKEETESPWVSTRSTPEGVVLYSRNLTENLVPNVVDMGLKDAIYLLESLGLKVSVNGRGTVRNQSVQAGSLARKGDIIALNMSITEG